MKSSFLNKIFIDIMLAHRIEVGDKDFIQLDRCVILEVK
jgi:hypothetical protein